MLSHSDIRNYLVPIRDYIRYILYSNSLDPSIFIVFLTLHSRLCMEKYLDQTWSPWMKSKNTVPPRGALLKVKSWWREYVLPWGTYKIHYACTTLSSSQIQQILLQCRVQGRPESLTQGHNQATVTKTGLAKNREGSLSTKSTFWAPNPSRFSCQSPPWSQAPSWWGVPWTSTIQASYWPWSSKIRSRSNSCLTDKNKSAESACIAIQNCMEGIHLADLGTCGKSKLCAPIG